MHEQKSQDKPQSRSNQHQGKEYQLCWFYHLKSNSWLCLLQSEQIQYWKITILPRFYFILSKCISTHKYIHKLGLCVYLYVHVHVHLPVYVKRERERERPITTVKLEEITSVTDKPTKAQLYCVDRLPTLSTTPPAIANKTEGQLSCIKRPRRIMNHL